jgi:hypothetical protein
LVSLIHFAAINIVKMATRAMISRASRLSLKAVRPSIDISIFYFIENAAQMILKDCIICEMNIKRVY